MRFILRKPTRRELYRLVKAAMRRHVRVAWKRTRVSLDQALVRFLRGRTAAELLRFARKPLIAAAMFLGAMAGPEARPDTIQLSDIALDTNDGGYVSYGKRAYDMAGWSVSHAGDVNGDGLGDFVAGAPEADPNGAFSGTSYVVFGKADGGHIELGNVALPGNDGGFAIHGAGSNDRSGFRVSGGGDVNGDGFDDVLVSAPYFNFYNPENAESGAVYVIFGKADGERIQLKEIPAADDPRGFALFGNSLDHIAYASIAGDVNGDGFADIVVAGVDAGSTGYWAGITYVVFGRASWESIDLQEVASDSDDRGFVIRGARPHDYSGSTIAAAGDTNGDGLDDIIVGAPEARLDAPRTSAGVCYLIFGKSDGAAIELIDIESGADPRGYPIFGAAAQHNAGSSISGAADVNGDGLADMIVGALNASPNAIALAGTTYVVFGKQNAAAVELSEFGSPGYSGGFAIHGSTSLARCGMAVAGGGDVNGDGLGDVLVRCSDSENFRNTFHLIFGKSDSHAVQVADLEAAGNQKGFTIFAQEPTGGTDTAVSLAGDLNGDGLADMLLGAPGTDVNGTLSGSVYAVFSPFGNGVWVDFGYTGPSTGSYAQPFSTLADALQAVSPGETIRIKAFSGVNTAAETPIIEKQVTVEAVGGLVRIGTP